VFKIWRSVDIHFAHHVRGHLGSCINVHGHSWKFEVCCAANTLDIQGFVVDFRQLSVDVLTPCHALLDHALAIGSDTFAEVEGELAQLGEKLLASRSTVHGADAPPASTPTIELGGAQARYPGGMKVAVFPFSPTSERLAEWFWRVADARLGDTRVHVPWVKVYETLHPVESVAEYAAPAARS
jgi:6-pyruvoyl-tetrahydropterin synthase